MKTLILIIAILFAFTTANAQQNKLNPARNFNVPVVVKNAFAAKFPTATNVKWGAAKDRKYEADFQLNNHDVSAFYTPAGVLIKTDTEIKQAELPKSIKDYLLKNFAGYKIDEIDKLEAKGKTSYQMKATNDKFEYDLLFDGNGKILKKEKYSNED
jgi:hypothetical protein